MLLINYKNNQEHYCKKSNGLAQKDKYDQQLQNNLERQMRLKKGTKARQIDQKKSSWTIQATSQEMI